MNRFFTSSKWLTLLASIAILPSLTSAQSDSRSAEAKAIVKSVTRDRRSRGIEVRARLVTEGTKGAKPETKQIVIKRRNVGDKNYTLYQAYWPKNWKGHAVVIETRNGNLERGFFFQPPDKVAKMGPDAMGKSLLGSTLTVEDVSESFWNWPNPTIIERSHVGKTECVIIEFRAPPGTPGKTRTVRAWIDEKINLPLIVDKFDQSGRATKRIHAESLKRSSEGEWIPGKLRIESFKTSTQTHVIPSRGKRDINIPEEDFSIEALQRISTSNPIDNP